VLNINSVGLVKLPQFPLAFLYFYLTITAKQFCHSIGNVKYIDARECNPKKVLEMEPEGEFSSKKWQVLERRITCPTCYICNHLHRSCNCYINTLYFGEIYQNQIDGNSGKHLKCSWGMVCNFS